MKRQLYVGAMFLAVLVALAIASHLLGKRAVVQANGEQAPKFEVDPMWPKPLPNHWLMGNTIGVSVDSNDHIWIIHRQASLEPMENYAAAKNVSEEVLRLISLNRKFMKLSNVIRALINNPRAPIDITLPLLKHLNDRDIKIVSLNRNIPDVIRSMATKMIRQKADAAKPKLPGGH